MTTGDSGTTAVFVSRPVSYLLPPLVIAAALAVPLLSGLATGQFTDPFRTVLFAVLAAGQLVLGVTGFRRARRQPWAVEIGPAGVAWYDSGVRLPWSTIQEVQVPPRSSRFRWWFNGVRIIDKRRTEHAVKARNRPIVHIIQTRHLTASRDEILAALADFAQAPQRG